MISALTIEGWLAQALGLLLVAALLSSRPPSAANRLLAAALLCAVYRQFLLTLQISGVLAAVPILFLTSFAFQLLAIPMFYLYVRALTTADFSLNRRDAIHFVPFALGLGCAGFAWPFDLYFGIVAKVFVASPYLILAHRQVTNFACEAKNQLSDLTSLRLRWLSILLVVVYLMTGVDLLDVVTGPAIPVWYLVPTFGLISLMALAYFSLRVSPVFARATDHPREREEKKETSRLPDEQLERQKERLVEVLEKQSLYLNPELRLSDLADAMTLRPYRVSEILSRGLQTSFYDLINRYRVTHAQRLLLSPDSTYLNLLGVGMESGFKSKSVFNDAFRKITGMTPSEFRMRNTTESIHSDDRIARGGR
jgi:AraC-like DNA-binding protein